ncbi:GtrA family protein [Streptomyces sp. NPDC017966]|uniref:GtrA family protein n=1 Tax=unclassified Streptomyces TaxID=2593676 RepID=UPI001C236D15|nr:GtrA family protein [Streptomyces sp. AC558_RSS880]
MTATDTPARTERPPRKLRQLVSYTLVGGSGVALDLAAFALLYNVLGWHEQVANGVGTTLGITNNFVLNAVFTFGKRDRLALRFVRFYAVGMCGIALTIGLLWLFAGRLGTDPNLVKAASLPLVLAVQFVLNRKWSFA